MSETLVTIDNIAFGGDGVGRLENGKAVFIPFAAIGDKLKIKIIQEKKRFCRAIILEILEAGPDRQTPPCRYYGSCDGCQYQHINDQAEYLLKANQLKNQLKRMAHIDINNIEMPLKQQDYYNYRNKLTLQHQNGKYGLRTIDKDHIFQLSECLIATTSINQRLAVGKYEGANDILIRSDHQNEAHQSWSRGKFDARILEEELLGKLVKVPLGSFYQVNPPVLNALMNWLKEALASQSIPLLIDAYCGVGVFSLGLNDLVERSVGIEIDDKSITIAKQNAINWGVENAEFIANSVEREMAQLLNSERDATVIIDPPRKGCSEKILSVLKDKKPKQIIYVSCNPSTLARDLKSLNEDNSYKISRIAAFNMFPKTAHFEAVTILNRL